MFEAKYHGVCAECGDDIEPGDPVRYVGDGLVHVDCQDPERRTSTRPRKAAEVCTTCWLEKPCACDDERKVQ